MGIIHKGEMEDKIDLLYSLFDINNDHCVDKPEMIGLFNNFFNILKKVSFKSEMQKPLKNLASECNEFETNDVIIQLVDDIFHNYAKTDDNFLSADEQREYIQDVFDTQNIE